MYGLLIIPLAMFAFLFMVSAIKKKRLAALNDEKYDQDRQKLLLRVEEAIEKKKKETKPDNTQK